jgi:hypothetical protein
MSGGAAQGGTIGAVHAIDAVVSPVAGSNKKQTPQLNGQYMDH